ncbi:hypothetical protein O0I10_006270 [Lichtheimia ornata]|uniref:Uncharacterized protein n=1 Tax=Lichtheimia ornata TaxID=688661 RepID=A0AAD7V288_9FUNG|nr:uncharacterized protein O0I10_006270 [Lichtheimia ornata]KAJ8657999.1 hypothetical protein O0I10_006270 [Lichtheimia ornata]
MADSIWHALCKHPTQPVSTEKYATIVDDATTQLHEPIHSILSTLNRRAMALTKLANFESALHDAKAIQQLSPSLALGYIRAADIHSEQGKQQQAIDVCIKGLDVVDANDHGYATLQRAKMDAEQRLDTRIDFISELPLDVANTSLVPMFIDRHLQWDVQCPYLYVSNLWRNCVFQFMDGSEFDILYQGDDLTPVVQLARHLKILEVDEYSKGTWLGDLLRNNDFGSLQQLTIGDVSANCVNHFVSSLKAVSSTLTHLEIEHDGETTLPIGDILVNCPNLVSLEITQPNAAPDISSLPMTTWPKLTTFNMFLCGKNMITCDEIIAIGKRFPSLKRLQVSPCEDMESTRVVLDHYPWMNSLCLITFVVGSCMIFLDDGPRCEDVGITRLDLITYCRENGPWKRVIHILQQHQKTLESIDFDVATSNEPREIYSIEYARLKKLRLCKSGWWIPHNAPMLEELEISWSCSLGSESTMPDAIPLPPTLKKLELRLYPGNNDTEKAPLERCIHQYAHHPQLKELVIAFDMSKDIDNVLDAIHHLGHLECLSIECAGNWDTIHMQRFFDGLGKGCPRLSSLVISCRHVPEMYPMNALKRLEHLEEFGVSIKNTHDDDGFWHAIQTFSQLKRIHVYPGNGTNMDHLRRLHEQRPDLKIVVNKRLTFR